MLQLVVILAIFTQLNAIKYVLVHHRTKRIFEIFQTKAAVTHKIAMLLKLRLKENKLSEVIVPFWCLLVLVTKFISVLTAHRILIFTLDDWDTRSGGDGLKCQQPNQKLWIQWKFSVLFD